MKLTVEFVGAGGEKEERVFEAEVLYHRLNGEQLTISGGSAVQGWGSMELPELAMFRWERVSVLTWEP